MNNLPFESAELAVALRAGAAGGKIVRSYFDQSDRTADETTSKANQGLVTAADVESEQVIVNEIKNVFPSHSILAEENFSTINTSPDNTKNLWIIDPLDGTNNFVHRIPHFAVSIAYYEKLVPKIGVVINPINGDCFVSGQGRGAWFGGNRVSVNDHRSLTDTIVGVGFYYNRGQMMRCTLAAIGDLFEQNIQGIRRMGTAALDLIYVGIGRFGAYFEYELSPWDFAAAQLFVEEAGGTVTDCFGQPLTLAKSSILASNGLLHPEVLEIVQRNAESL